MANQFINKLDFRKARDIVDDTEGLKDAAEFLLDEANKLVPIDEGTLMNSGNTAVDKSTLSAAVYYDTPYAVRQHEDMTLRHTGGRKAKYLETPFKSFQTRLLEIIARKINTRIGDK